MSIDNIGKRYSRQSFIGDQSILEGTKVGVVGLGGGGSAVLVQLAHMGFCNVVGFDPNNGVEEKHLNRTIGISVDDVKNGITKAQNARRVFEGLHPNSNALFLQDCWQNHADILKHCKVIWGCVDSLSDREQLEAFCRFNMIQLIDIGLCIEKRSGVIARMSGQIIVSSPGQACMHCMGFLNDKDLAVEASQYGDPGIRTQVIWGNMVLAGSAVGLGVQLITKWAGATNGPVYLQYDGNSHLVSPHPRLEYLDLSKPCMHFPLTDQVSIIPDVSEMPLNV